MSSRTTRGDGDAVAHRSASRYADLNRGNVVTFLISRFPKAGSIMHDDTSASMDLKRLGERAACIMTCIAMGMAFAFS